MKDTELAIWVIYIKGLAPHPDKHIARKHVMAGGDTYPTLEIEIADTLEELRKMMEQKGLIYIPRFENDDAVIIETWI